MRSSLPSPSVVLLLTVVLLMATSGCRNLLTLMPGLGRLSGGRGIDSSGPTLSRALLLILGINLKEQITEHVDKLKERQRRRAWRLRDQRGRGL